MSSVFQPILLYEGIVTTVRSNLKQGACSHSSSTQNFCTELELQVHSPSHSSCLKTPIMLFLNHTETKCAYNAILSPVDLVSMSPSAITHPDMTQPKHPSFVRHMFVIRPFISVFHSSSHLSYRCRIRCLSI